VERFERRYPEAPFMGLVKLKRSGNLETYIYEFLKISIMVLDLFAARRVYMFVDALEEPLHGCLSPPSPIPFKMPLKGIDFYKIACQRERKHFSKSPLFHQMEKMIRSLFQRREKGKNL